MLCPADLRVSVSLRQNPLSRLQIRYIKTLRTFYEGLEKYCESQRLNAVR
jgi:hypothetical protein